MAIYLQVSLIRKMSYSLNSRKLKNWVMMKKRNFVISVPNWGGGGDLHHHRIFFFFSSHIIGTSITEWD